MEHTMPDPAARRNSNAERLDTIIKNLPDAQRAEVWRGVALNLAEGYDEGKP